MHIAACRFGPEWQRAIEEERDLGFKLIEQVTAEARRNADRHAQASGSQPLIHFGLAPQGRLLLEIARAGEAFDQVTALAALVAIEYRKGQVFDVEGDSVAKDRQENHRPQQRNSKADRIAHQFTHFTPRDGPNSSGRCTKLAVRARRNGAGGHSWRLGRNPVTYDGGRNVSGLLQVGHEGILERGSDLGRPQLLRHSHRENFAGMHQRDAVAALGFVHEVGRDEDRHPVPPRQVVEQSPEQVARCRVDA